MGSPIALSAAVLGLSATDDVDGATPVAVAPTSAGLGDTNVTATAVDKAGNKTVKSFKVHVADTVAPTIVSLAVTQTQVGRGDHRAIQATVSAQTTDAGDPSPNVKIASVTPVGGCGVVGWTVTGPLTVVFRADGRIWGRTRTYAVVVQATDASGNTSTATLNVVIGHGAFGDRDGGDDGDDRGDCGDRRDD
jgi:hypothetical protein